MDLASRYTVLAIPGKEEKLKKAIESTKPRHKTCTIPFARNPQFFGRKGELGQLDNLLKKPNSPENKNVPAVAIWGDGGVGKTEIALEYAWSKASEYDVVLWVSARSRIAIQQSLTNASKTALGLKHAQGKLHLKNAVFVMQWLKTTGIVVFLSFLICEQ